MASFHFNKPILSLLSTRKHSDTQSEFTYKLSPERCALLSFFVSFVLRILFVGRPELSNDEAFTLYWSSGSWSSLFNMLPTENNPPLHFMLSKLWVQLVGSDAVLARLPSVFISSLTVGLTCWLGFRYLRPVVGLTAAGILLFSCYEVQFSHENRAFALLGLLTLLAAHLLLRFRERPDSFLRGAGLVLTLVLLLYLHVMALFVGMALGIALLVHERSARVWRGVIYCFVAVGVLYLPYVQILLERTRNYVVATNHVIAPPSGLDSLYNILWAFTNQPLVAVISIVMLVLSLYWLYRQKTNPNEAKWTFAKTLFLTLFLSGWLLVFAVSYVAPMYSSRYLIFAHAPFALFLAWQIQVFPKPHSHFAALLIVGLMAATYSPWHKEKHLIPSQISTQIESFRSENQPLFIVPGWESLAYAYYVLDTRVSDADHVGKRLKEKQIWGPVIHSLSIDSIPYYVDFTSQKEMPFRQLYEPSDTLYVYLVAGEWLSERQDLKHSLQKHYTKETEFPLPEAAQGKLLRFTR